ncbi:olfactory receptor 10A3-like [Polyodon spathula]|uniref:olfactory receptor 10A3-like n=1 Tax=Polyodon spathula TaxID=7913 RepID=UPI001B7E4FA3|nr:olfactory receptor 10A3-like [Polyodon spathula]
MYYVLFQCKDGLEYPECKLEEAMVNHTVSTLLLTGFGEAGSSLSCLYFALTLVAFLLTVFVNLVLIVLIYLKQNLHQPMYVFLCSLCINGLYGSLALYPTLLNSFLSNPKVISLVGCLLQMFLIDTYAGFECTILSVMAYDRYVSICKPLQYHSIMTTSNISILLFFAWLFPVCLFTVMVALTSSLPLCGNTIEKVYCSNASVVRLSCVDASRERMYAIFVTLVIPCVPVLLVLLSYQKILSVCLKASSDNRSKALNTCIPHIVTFVNYTGNIFFEVISYLLENTNVSFPVRSFMSLQLFIIPPLLNPIVYGIRLQEIRKTIVQIIYRGKIRSTFQ